MSENCDELVCFERNKFFNGKFITAADLTKEQEYVIEKNKLHNRMLGHGVVYGLKVKKAYPLDTKIIIEPGHAMDCYGNDIVLCTEKVVDIADKIKECRPKTPGIPCPDTGPAIGNVEQSIDDFTEFPSETGTKHTFKGLTFRSGTAFDTSGKALYFETFTFLEITFPKPVTEVSLDIKHKIDLEAESLELLPLAAVAGLNSDVVGSPVAQTTDDWILEFKDTKINKILIVLESSLNNPVSGAAAVYHISALKHYPDTSEMDIPETSNVYLNKISWSEESEALFTNFAVALKYAECEKDPVPVHGVVCGSSRQCDYNTIKETYEVELLCRDEFPDGCGDMELDFEAIEFVLSNSNDEEKLAELVQRYTEQTGRIRKRDIIYSGPECCQCPLVFLAIISVSETGEIYICNLFRNHVYTIPMFLYYLEMRLPMQYRFLPIVMYNEFCIKGMSRKEISAGREISPGRIDSTSRLVGMKAADAKRVLNTKGIQANEVSTSVRENVFKYEPEMFSPETVFANLITREPAPDKGDSVDLIVDNRGNVIDYVIRKEPAEVEALRTHVKELEEKTSFSYRMKDRVFDLSYVPHYAADIAHEVTDEIIKEIPLTKVTGITEDSARKIAREMPEIMSISDLVNADPAEVAAVTGKTTDEAAKSLNSASRLVRKVARSTAKEMKAKKVFSKEEVKEIDIHIIAEEVDLSRDISDLIRSRLISRTK